MKHKLGFIALLFIFSFSIFAQEAQPFKEKLRPWIEKIAGEEFSIKWLGDKPEQIELPLLPQINSDTRSVAVYEKKVIGKNIKSKDEEQKLNYFFVKELYVAVRAVEPQGDELSRWLNTLDQGATREGVYRALVMDDQYLGLENFNKPTTEGVVQFANWFFPRFIGVSLPQIEKVGFYTLKKEASERALEIIDAFGTDSAKLYNWYAVFSAELAEKYPQAFQMDLRNSPSKKRHKLWAQNSPEQHLKSEMIIKLHTIFNLLER